MKGELIHLLERLVAEREGFQCIQVFPNGSASAVYRWGCKPFASLDELEAWLWQGKKIITIETTRAMGKTVTIPPTTKQEAS